MKPSCQEVMPTHNCSRSCPRLCTSAKLESTGAHCYGSGRPVIHSLEVSPLESILQKAAAVCLQQWAYRYSFLLR